MGYFEKHINRMRNYYRSQRDEMISCIKQHPLYNKISIREENAGLHFLLEVDTPHSDEDLVQRAKANGIRVSCLSEYHVQKTPDDVQTLIINYFGIKKERIQEAVERLFSSL